MKRIGIVGHRFLQEEEKRFVSEQCGYLLRELQAEHENIIACSAIAEGADSLFAEAALLLNIPLEIVLPFDEYEYDFVSEKALQTFLALKSAASETTILPFSTRSDDAYVAGMHWILDGTDIIIAVWNGETNGGRGGTSDSVMHIINDDLDWIHIDILHYTTNVYIKRSGFSHL